MWILILFVSMAFGQYTEDEAVDYIQKLDNIAGTWKNKYMRASWEYQTNLTEENKNRMIKTTLELGKESEKHLQETKKFPWKSFKNETLKRQFDYYTRIGKSALPAGKQEKVETIASSLHENYNKAKLCDYKDKNKCDLSLDPELTNVFISSRDPEELKYYWSAWRDKFDVKIKDMYKSWVELATEAANLNNEVDLFADWIHDYESKTFEKDMEILLDQVSPLYKQLHAYVRRRLLLKYGSDIVSKDGPIPAHLLGNMWGQTWSNIEDIVTPFPNVNPRRVTEEMKKQNYTVLKMFKVAEEFFTSLGLDEMPEQFWKNSIIKKPIGRELVCHASAWDFHDGKDFRIKMCTQISEEELLVIHHEMGHIQYFLQYKDQPVVFRRGANPGFHESIGDVMSLSVGTNKHLSKIGLQKGIIETKKSMINSLLSLALQTVAFLPYGYLIDRYRWNIFQGKTKPENYNCDWWKLRHKYQGLEPPENRTENNFDAAAKYHVSSHTPYIRYFVSHILQFEFLEALCKEAGEYDPEIEVKKYLHQCDIYKNKKAGKLLGNMLRMGSSRPWPEALKSVTGKKVMDASSILKYFKPLYDWLIEENKKTGEHIGWKESRTVCL